jgi:phosphohistidine phosphatase
MQVYLLRHGVAEVARPGSRDSDRHLTADGRKKLRGIIKRASAAGLSPTMIISSPYTRALETAEAAAQVLKFGGEILRTRALAPGGTPEAVWQEIRVHKDEAQILLTGHEPQFSQLTSYLLSAPALRVDFKKGAVIRIDFDTIGVKPHGTLRWMIAPKMA